MEKRKIMIIDDDSDILLILEMILESNNFVVEAFSDPLSALHAYKSSYYDLILIDLKLPQINGFDLYKRIRKIDNETKICFITASEQYHKQYREKEFSTFNEDLFILKPIETEELIKKINGIVNEMSNCYNKW